MTIDRKPGLYKKGSADIADNAVTNVKLADMAQATIKGRADGAGTGDPTDLSAAQVKTIIDLQSAVGAGSTNISTTSNSLQDVTGLSVTLTTKASEVMVFVSIPMKTSSGAGLATINFDTVDGSILATTSSTTDQTLTFFARYSVSAGSHTWKVRYRNSDGVSTISLNMSSIQAGTIAVVVL